MTETLSNKNPSTTSSDGSILIVAIGLCIAAVLTALFRWILMEVLTVFLEPLLEGALWLALIVMFIVCSVRAITRRRQKPTAEYKSLALIVATFLVLIFFPFNTLTLKANHVLLHKRREQLVACLSDRTCGTILTSGGRGDFVSLPAGSHSLSVDGEVAVDRRQGKTFILFFTFRGVLDRFSGYVYSLSDDPPAKDQFLGDGVEIQKVAPHWYWYAS